ncbi:MAG TPA: hypothetical protein VGJ92_13880 [Methanocella sp.]
MSRAEDIAARLPHFYMAWDRTSTMSTIIRAAARMMDDSETDLAAILKSHWVDSATGHDLDRHGLLLSVFRNEGESDADFRGRIKTAIVSYSGGGTVDSVQMMVRIALGLSHDYPIEVIENPPVQRTKTWEVTANRGFTVEPWSIADCPASITVEVRTPDVKITSPTLINLDTEETFTYNGNLYYGDVLQFTEGQAFVNGTDRTDRLLAPGPVVLPRRNTRWLYTESIGSNLGVYDKAHFDQSVFAVDILTAITFEWTALKPAAFEVLVPKERLERANVRPEYLQQLLDSQKACGVSGVVKII